MPRSTPGAPAALPATLLALAAAGLAAGPAQATAPGLFGTAEFRTALRDAIEGTKEFVGSQGVFNMGPADHNGVDQRAQVMVRIENGTWKLQN